MDAIASADQLAQTLDAPPEDTPPASPRRPAPILVEGSTPALSAETDQLLHLRLKAAALLLFVGFLAFFVKNLFFLDELTSTLEWAAFWDHLAITILTGLLGFRLCTDCQHALRHLRLVELLIFGGSALFFFLVSIMMRLEGASKGFVASIAPMWMILMFTYALFIPNNWRRAAVIIGLMVALPIAVIVTVRFSSDEYIRMITTNPAVRPRVLDSTMALMLSAVSAVGGVYLINTLRREAFEAKRLGHYQLKRRIGAGGMGEVYLAEHLMMKRPCAIKVIRPEKTGDAQALVRFEREVRETARLTHWNTVEIFDYGRADDGTFYYVMEYLPGMTLDQLVEMFGALPPERAVHLLLQSCDALAEAHSNGLIHRDLKPANIFAAHRGGVFDVAKLLDFGLAKPITAVDDAGLTQEGTITGSPLFMSPEQAVGEPADERSDIYSLGVVAWFLLVGEPPFRNTNPLKVMLDHANTTPDTVNVRNSDVAEDLAEVIARCLEKDPDHRFQTAGDLRNALADCDCSERWSRERAQAWWRDYGCPMKKQLDADVFEQACVA